MESFSDPAALVHALGSFTGAVVTAVLGTFLGAWLAFAFERRVRDREQVSRQVEAGYAAMISLGAMLTSVHGVRISLIDPHRTSRAPWYDMPTLGVVPHVESQFTARDLAFLMTTGNADDAAAVEAALSAERAFYSTIALLSERNRQKVDATKLLAPHATAGRIFSDDELTAIFGRQLKQFLQHSTTGLIAAVDECEPRLLLALQTLRDALQRAHPTHVYWHFQGLKAYGGSAADSSGAASREG